MKRRNVCGCSSLWFDSTITSRLTINDIDILSDMGYVSNIEDVQDNIFEFALYFEFASKLIKVLIKVRSRPSWTYILQILRNVYISLRQVGPLSAGILGPFLLTWINLNPGMDK